jgi:hypothetical protein
LPPSKARLERCTFGKITPKPTGHLHQSDFGMTDS